MPTITVKRCHIIQKEGKAKAFLSLDINGVVVIHGCRLVEGSNGLFLAMPQEHSQKDNKWYDIVQIVQPELKSLMQSEAIKHYEQTVGVESAAGHKSEDPF